MYNNEIIDARGFEVAGLVILQKVGVVCLVAEGTSQTKSFVSARPHVNHYSPGALT